VRPASRVSRRRSDGLDGVGLAGLRIEVTARVISSVAAKYSACKWHQIAVGHRLDAFHAACAAKGAEENCDWARAIHRCLPMRHPQLPQAVSPVCSAATGGQPWHPGLTTAFPLRDRARRLPCHLAHMELAAMSRPQAQQSPVARTTAGRLTAPNTRQLRA
jgi:hypothetical protein